MYWLISSFVWGFLRICVVNTLPPPWTEPEVHEWSFGQVAPLVLLIAPVISMVEAYFSGNNATPLDSILFHGAVSNTHHITYIEREPSITGEELQPQTRGNVATLQETSGSPKYSFQHREFGTKSCVFIIFAIMIVISCILFEFVWYLNKPRFFLLPNQDLGDWAPFNLFFYFYLFILFFLLIEKCGGKGVLKCYILVVTCAIIVRYIIWIKVPLHTAFSLDFYIQMALLSIYVLFSLFECVWEMILRPMLFPFA